VRIASRTGLERGPTSERGRPGHGNSASQTAGRIPQLPRIYILKALSLVRMRRRWPFRHRREPRMDHLQPLSGKPRTRIRSERYAGQGVNVSIESQPKNQIAKSGMSELSPKQHARRAGLLLGLGALLAIVPAVGMYYDTNRSMVLLLILLLVATLPAIGWGASHLALSRGYSTGGGCGLCIVGYIVSGFLGTTSPHPLALGVGVLFIVLLPTVVLLALPNKSGHSPRKRHR
jgi:hypothetical protein